MKIVTHLVAALMLLLGAVAPAQAHKASDAYLQIEAGERGTTARVDVALRDLDQLLAIDADADGQLTWGEVRTAWPAIERTVREGVRVEGCELASAGRGLERRSDGAYAVLHLRSDCVLGDPADPATPDTRRRHRGAGFCQNRRIILNQRPHS